MNTEHSGENICSDPVKAFEQARLRPGSAAAKLDTEMKIRERINRQPLVAMYLSYRYPGAGMFYIRRPAAGLAIGGAFLFCVIVIFCISSTFLAGCLPDNWINGFCSSFAWMEKVISPLRVLGILVKLALVFLFDLVFCVCTSAYTYSEAKKDRQQAIEDLERFKREEAAAAE